MAAMMMLCRVFLAASFVVGVVGIVYAISPLTRLRKEDIYDALNREPLV